MEVTNRFKGLDLIDRVLDELRMEVHYIVQEAGIKTMPKKRYAKRQKGCLRSYPKSEVRGSGWEHLAHAPTPEGRGGGWEDQPHVQGAVAAQAQEGLEELSHVEGQEGRR